MESKASLGDNVLRFGIALPNWGETGDPRVAAELAMTAEDAGWDGYFTWDDLIASDDPLPTYDPFVILSSVAAATERIRIGTSVLIPARYEPHLLAMRLASLDILSQGRLIVGVGLGNGGRNFEVFGHPGEASIRAEKLDEALDVICRLWSGEVVHHSGRHFQINGFRLNPLPMQQPRIPIWVGGDSSAALRRAARWDGWIGPDDDPADGTIDDLAAVREAIGRFSESDVQFDIAWAGRIGSRGHQPIDIARAGATWHITPLVGSLEEVINRIRSGPPE